MWGTTHQPMENNADRRMCISIIWPPKFYPTALNFTHILPFCKYLFLSERLSNPLLKQVKKSPDNLIKENFISYTDASQ